MKNEENRKYIKAGLTAIAVIAAALILFMILYQMDNIKKNVSGVLSILMPFVYGAGIAYILSPLCGKLETFFGNTLGKKKLGNALSILISILVFLAVVVAIVLIIVPQVIQSIITLMNTLPGQLRAWSRRIESLTEMDPDFRRLWESISAQVVTKIEEFRDGGIMPVVQAVLSGTATYVSLLLKVLKDLILGIVIAVYFLATRKQFATQSRLVLYSLLPEKWAGLIEQEIQYGDRMFNGFFIGKLLDSTIVGIICFIGCSIMKLPSAALIAVIIGVTNIIPFFGPFIGAVPCALLLLISNPIHALMFVIFIVILQQVDGDIIGPRILGNSIGLSGFWITFAIVLFGGLWGLFGMIIGVPLFAVIYDVLRKLCYHFLKKKGLGAMIEAYNARFHAPLPEKPQNKK